jgi:uncharacterized protein with ParB-like and HNH nuclease domain
MMEVKPNYCAMDTVFGESTVFKVPKYQRAYSWQVNNVKQFCDDLFDLYTQKKTEGHVGQHFLGGIVCVRQGNEDELDEKVIYQLVDGQQRLSTTVLMVSRIINYLQEVKLTGEQSETRDKRVKKYKSKFVTLITEENGKDTEFDRITLSKRDDAYYKEVLQNRFGDSKIKSHILIKNASNEIDRWLKKFNDPVGATVIENVDLMYKVLCKSCRILLLKMTNVSDAYKLFQVINDRGRSLTAGDLLRASSLGTVDRANEHKDDENKIEIDDLEKQWDLITAEGSLSTDKKLITYYTAKKAKSINKTSLFGDFNSNFFSDEEEIPNRIDDIQKQLTKLKNLSEGIWPYADSNLSEYQRAKLHNLVVQFKHTHCLPLLISATELTEKKFYQLVFFLEKFFFMFRVCLNKTMTPVTKAYYRAIKKINECPIKYQVKWFCDDLKVIIEKINLTEFSEKLKSFNYLDDGDNKNLKYLLITLEESSKWVSNGHKGNYLNIYKNHSKTLAQPKSFSIEHVYPANAEPKNKLPEMEALKNELGNLALLYQQENEECGNKLIIDKAAVYDRCRINITKSLSYHEHFTQENKVEREKLLLIDLMIIFSLGYRSVKEISDIFISEEKTE